MTEDNDRKVWRIRGTAMRWNVPCVDRPDRFARDSILVRYEGNDVHANTLDLAPGRIPILLDHDHRSVVGWVDGLSGGKDGLRMSGFVLPRLLPPDVCELRRFGALPAMSISTHKLDYAPRDHGDNCEPPVCTRALLTEISLTWMPSMSGCRVEHVKESIL